MEVARGVCAIRVCTQKAAVHENVEGMLYCVLILFYFIDKFIHSLFVFAEKKE